jgi:hypothetical protein
LTLSVIAMSEARKLFRTPREDWIASLAMTTLGQLASTAPLIISATFSPIMMVGNATVPADGVQFSLPVPERAREIVENRSIQLIMNINSG